MNKNLFPITDISEEDADFIKLIWGKPIPNPEYVAWFLQTGGKPLLERNPPLVRYIYSIKAHIGDNLGLSNTQGGAAFTTGAELYASVFSWVTKQHILPIGAETIERVGQMDEIDFILDSGAQLRDNDPRFCALIDRMAPAMGVDPEFREVIQIGAGALHLVMQEANKADAVLAGYETDPALEDLRLFFHGNTF